MRIFPKMHLIVFYTVVLPKYIYSEQILWRGHAVKVKSCILDLRADHFWLYRWKNVKIG